MKGRKEIYINDNNFEPRMRDERQRERERERERDDTVVWLLW